MIQSVVKVRQMGDCMYNDMKKELISKLLSETIIEIINMSMDDFGEKITEASVEILGKIVEIVKSEEFDDFSAMEEIVCVLEESGINCGGRHDF